MRCVVYCRVSSKAQEDDGTSLDTQEAKCLTYAVSQGWNVVKVFRETYSGYKLWERPLIGEVRQLAREKAIDIILSYSTDRLARKQTHMGLLVSECERFNVRLQFVTEDFENSALGTFMRNAATFAGEMEREKIAERTQRGKRAKVEGTNGKPPMIYSTRPLYGYRWRDAEKGAYAIDETTSVVVKRIFSDYLRGGTIRGIATKLGAEGIPSSRGNAVWNPATVRDILTHRGYMGEAWAWAWKGKGGTFEVNEDSVLLPAGTIPPLVTVAEWENVQALFVVNKQRAARNNKYPEAALLRGIAVCGHCDGTMHVINRTYKMEGGRRVCYRCGTHAHDRTQCKEHVIRAEVVDGGVWEQVSAILSNPAVLQREVERLLSQDTVAHDLQSVDRAMKDTEREYDRLWAKYTKEDDEDFAAALKVELKRLREQKQGLTGEREVIMSRQGQWKAMREKLQNLTAWCVAMAANIDDATYEDKQLAMEALGLKVKVYGMRHTPKWTATVNVPLEGVSTVITPTGMSTREYRRFTAR